MKLSEAIRTTIRRLHYSPRTEESYVRWALAFVGFHGRRHPRDLGAAEVTAFLNDLAVRRPGLVLDAEPGALRAGLPLPQGAPPRDARTHRARARSAGSISPRSLSPREVRALLDHLEAPFRLIGELLYGAGLRVGEVTALRVKVIVLDRRHGSPSEALRGKATRDAATALLPGWRDVSRRDGLGARARRRGEATPRRTRPRRPSEQFDPPDQTAHSLSEQVDPPDQPVHH